MGARDAIREAWMIQEISTEVLTNLSNSCTPTEFSPSVGLTMLVHGEITLSSAKRDNPLSRFAEKFFSVRPVLILEFLVVKFDIALCMSGPA